MSEKMYRVRGDRTRAPGWWEHLGSIEWPEPIAGVRALLAGDEVLVSLDTAEYFRRWAVAQPGWPRPAQGPAPIAFCCIGYADARGDARTRWATALWVSEAERDAIEVAAAKAKKSVGAYLRDLALS